MLKDPSKRLSRVIIMATLSPVEYLDSQKIDYTLLPHSISYTAQDTAAKTHIKGNLLSKVVIVRSDDKLLMVVVPANCIVMQQSIARLLRSPSVTIVPEHQFKDHFPECETGAMPAFGNLYGMDVLIAKDLVKQDFITFSGGTHKILIKMKTSDFMKLSGARSISVGYKIASLAPPIISRLQEDWRWV